MAHQEDMEKLILVPKRPAWFFFPAWIVLTSICFPVAFLLIFPILRIIIRIVGDFIIVNGVQHITEDYLALYIFVPIVSVLTGVLQYALLSRYLPRMGGWVAATFGGWVLGMLLIVISGRLTWMDASTTLGLDIIFILIGFSIGAAQWLLLRKRLPRAGWWIVANILGWGLLGLVTAGPSLDQYALFTLGFLPACATAAALALLMNRLQAPEPRDW